MSSGNPVGIIGWKAVVDDSELLSSARSAFAKLQAEVESRGIKVPITAELGTSGGRPATFSASGTPSALSSSGGFSPNRPTAPNSGTGFIESPNPNDYRNVYYSTVAPALQANYESNSARVQRSWDMAALAQHRIEERDAGSLTRIQQGIYRGVQGSVGDDAYAGLNPGDIFTPAIAAGTRARRTANIWNATRSSRMGLSADEGSFGMMDDDELRSIGELDQRAASRGMDARLQSEAAERSRIAKGEEAAGSGIGSAGWAAARVGMIGLIGLHEASRIMSTEREGAFNMTMASTPADLLRAQSQMIQQSYSGFFGSVVGLAQDATGNGPTQLLEQNRGTIALLDSQTALHQEQFSAAYGPSLRSAVARGDSYAQRRIAAQRGIDAANDPQGTLGVQIRTIQSKLSGQHQESYTEPVANAQSITEVLAAAGVQDIESGTTVTKSRTVNDIQGDARTSLSNQLAELKIQRDEAVKNGSAELDAINREIRIAGRSLGSQAARSLQLAANNPYGASLVDVQEQAAAVGDMPAELQPQGARAAAASSIQFFARAGRDFAHQFRTGSVSAGVTNLQNQAAEAQLMHNPLQARLLDISAQRATALSSLHEQYLNQPAMESMLAPGVEKRFDLMGQQAQQDNIYANDYNRVGLMGSREQAFARINAPQSPAAMQAIAMAASGIQSGMQLAHEGQKDNASLEFGNTILGLQAGRADYLRGFKAQPFDFATRDMTNPADQTDPTSVLKRFDQKIKEVENARDKALAPVDPRMVQGNAAAAGSDNSVVTAVRKSAADIIAALSSLVSD